MIGIFHNKYSLLTSKIKHAEPASWNLKNAFTANFASAVCFLLNAYLVQARSQALFGILPLVKYLLTAHLQGF